jgi:hypothetical protein
MTPETRYFLDLMKAIALGLLAFALGCGAIFGFLCLLASL